MKYFSLIIFLFFSTSLFSQSFVIKKDNRYQEVVIDNDVEITFLNYTPCTTTKVYYEGGPNTDGVGVYYNTVLIGTQCWLKENLNVGTRIGISSDQTNNSIKEKYCYNDSEDNCTTYGGLYQWAEAVQYQDGATNSTSPIPAFSGNVQGLCPSGWHIPTLQEFQTLQTTVVNTRDVLVAIGQTNGTNTSGFSALFAGGIYIRHFYDLGTHGHFWSSTGSSSSNSYYMLLYIDEYFNYTDIKLYNYGKSSGFSVRCLKD